MKTIKVDYLSPPLINAWFRANMYPVMFYNAKKYKSFLTQEEFETCRGEVFKITAQRVKFEQDYKKKG